MIATHMEAIYSIRDMVATHHVEAIYSFREDRLQNIVLLLITCIWYATSRRDEHTYQWVYASALPIVEQRQTLFCANTYVELYLLGEGAITRICRVRPRSAICIMW